MYAFVERLDPDGFEAIAADAYAEMLEAGYTRVAEFHYLHHAPDGRPYADPAEMSRRVVAAAQRAGIGLTLVPALYRFSDAGGVAPTPSQRRFVQSRESFAALWEQLARELTADTDARLGLGFHSLRAVEPEDVTALVSLAGRNGAGATTPIHIHVSEQEREVEAVRARYGATPIELLARTVPLGPQWSLVHATHATDGELTTVANGGAVVVVAPTTEANLGDGIFPAAAFRARGGRIAIGSDSNVSLDVAEELRWLEYVQRLAVRRRHVLGTAGVASLGDALYAAAAAAGAQSLGRQAGALAKGLRADFVVLAATGDDIGPELAGDVPPSLDWYVFRSGAWRVRDVFVAGRAVVRGGRHVAREDLRARASRARKAFG